MRFPQDVPTLRDREGDADVCIRPHRPEDATGSLEQCLDPLSRRWTTVPWEYTLDDARRFVTQAMPGGWATDQEWGFAVEARDDTGTPRYAGTVSLRNEGDRRAEIAYGSHPWVRGRGVMERALRLLLGWGFEERGLETVIWWANRGNWASRRLAWRLGFTVEGSVRHWLPQRGVLLDAWVGTLLAGDRRRPAHPWFDVPLLRGQRAVLRPLRDSDTPRIVEGCGDAQVRRWLGSIPQPYGPADAVTWLEHIREAQASGSSVTWAVADPGSDQLCGVVNLFGVRVGLDAELGYWLHPAARGRGVATEAARLALRHGFVPAADGGLGLRRVRALAAEGNTGSLAVLRRAGFTVQGQERAAVLVGGGDGDPRLATAVVHDILASELTPSRRDL